MEYKRFVFPWVIDVWITLQVSDEHSELRSPISDVIETNDVVAEKLHQTSDAITFDVKLKNIQVNIRQFKLSSVQFEIRYKFKHCV